MAQIRLFILLSILALCLAGAAQADDFDRPGFYVGAGGGAAFDFLDGAIEEATGGIFDLTAGGSFNLRGGYRVASWFAVEGMYEGSWGIGTRALGIEFGNLSYNGLLVNAKFIVPVWRLQPYFILGVGAQGAKYDGLGPQDGLDLSRWDFMVRTGIGLDAYVNKHWVVNFEVTPSVSVRTFSDIASRVTDNVTMTVTGGVQYRF